MSLTDIKIVDCPRDAIQGLKKFISTEKKINYINQLIQSKLFDVIDFGSFVSAKAVPQMGDTAEVAQGLIKDDRTKLLAIIANERGAENAVKHPNIDFVGYPFSISETFQKRNTNVGIEDSYFRVKNILNIISGQPQELVIYISMAFGNPYGDLWNNELVLNWIQKLYNLGITRFSLADTTAEATPESVKQLFWDVTHQFPTLDFSVHLHSNMQNALPKIEAAYEAGCRQFEGAMLGYGGCPFAKDQLVGNIASELLLNRFKRGSIEELTSILQGFRDLIAE